MEKLLLCSRTLYDQDILSKMEILNKRIKNFNREKIFYNSYKEWFTKKEKAYLEVKNKINSCINNPNESMLSYGVTITQLIEISEIIENILKNLNMCDKWARIHSFHITQNVVMMFNSFITAGVWENMYNNMSREQIADIIYNNIKSQLDDALIDFVTFKCKKCDEITRHIYNENNICSKCENIIPQLS
tara:strand:+ start:157 stop:723 length:567 start_codon:yes stop_codon:yes gene_type:complete